MQVVSRGKKTLDRGIIKPSQLAISIKTKQDPTAINEVRIVPKKGCYVVEIVYEKNDGWKNGIEMGKKNNQTFVQIPHARFIEMLTYKAELVGIKVKLTEESYTSQASFLDRDEIPVYDETRKDKPKFSGRRIKRGLYRASDGREINADIQGASNIIRKVAPNAFDAEGVEECVVSPVRTVILRRNKQKVDARKC